jgi:glycosyltransferase involved in cell wall biosynthesis
VRPGAFDGGATYTLNVLRHLPSVLSEAQLIVYCREGEDRVPAADNVEVRHVPIRSAVRRALFETTALSRLDADVLISPNESLPARLPCPAVVVAQNLAYHCEFSPRSFRGGSAGERLASALQTMYYRRRMPEAYRRAAVVVAISKTAADLLARKASLPLDRTIVALGGSDSIFIRPPEGVVRDPDCLLIVSAIAPYKNFELAIDVLAGLRKSWPTLRLEIAGPDWRGYRRIIEERARQTGVADAVRFLGPVAPPALSELYATSAVLLHLSECEACPLPPLEAMRAGLPVIAARRSSIPEVVGEGALLVEPADSLAVVREIASLIGDNAALDMLRDRGRARAAELTWACTAEGIARAVRRAAS